ncbi:MAG: hypothetical protein P4L84_32590 [Isosphaeraceae bacterium]|nr:hypothetical protein [Isosphaeraceae bacterium]
MHDYDKTSKWLIQHHGDSILRIAGLRNLVAWRPLQAEVVQPRQLPDGLVEVTLAGEPEPHLFVLELATFPDQRLQEQVLRDMALVYLDRRVLPEVLTLVLHPKGNLRTGDTQELESPRGWTRWRMNWRVVELWTIPAEDLLTSGDLGAIPWVPLARIDGPPEPVIKECRERIDRQSPPEEHDNLLAVTAILTRLRYNDARLMAILGGKGSMLELPFLQELFAEKMQRAILSVLRARFTNVPNDLEDRLQPIEDEARLDELIEWAATCPDVNAFRARLSH